jgi:hypothetical protein
MRWLRVLGGLAVLYATLLALGTLASLVSANDLLVSSALQAPALTSIGVLLVAFVVTLAAAGPEDHWTENPYW